jgi:hypothetical protein
VVFNQKGKDDVSHLQHWMGEEFRTVIEKIVGTTMQLGYMESKNEVLHLSNAFETSLEK